MPSEDVTIIHALDVDIKEQMPTVTKIHEVVEGTQNVYEVGFTFDAEWDNFSITVIFVNGNIKKTYILGTTERIVQIPRSVIFAGTLFIGAYGVNMSQVITTQKPVGIAVKNVFGLPMQVDDEFTQTQYDILMQELYEVRQIAVQSIVTGEQVAQNAFDVEQNAEQVRIDRNTSEQYKNDALASKNAAKTSETNAANSATTAKASADIAQNLFDQLQPMNADVSSKAPSIISEAVGSVITLDDSSYMPLQSIIIYGKSTQDGTPTPDAPVEIVSVENPRLGVIGNNSLNFDEYIARVNNSEIAKYKEYKNIRCVEIPISEVNKLKTLLNCIALKPNTTYRVCISGYSNYNPSIQDDIETLVVIGKRKNDSLFMTDLRFKNIKSENKQSVEIEINTGNDVVGFYISYNRGTIVYLIPEECYIVEEGQELVTKPPQSLTFPYTLRGIPVTSGGNYTDESGQQWICDTVEVNADGTGKLVQRCYEDIINNKAWTRQTEERDKVLNLAFTLRFLGHEKYVRVLFCDIAPSTNGVLGYENNVAVNVCGLNMLGNIFLLDLSLEKFPTLESFTTFLSSSADIKMVYILATPIETDLTTEEVQAFLALHTNKPYSTIFNSAGADQKVEYVADTKLYIDKKIAELVSTSEV